MAPAPPLAEDFYVIGVDALFSMIDEEEIMRALRTGSAPFF